MNSYKLKIVGLDCVNCALELESDLNKIDIINNVSVNFMTQKISFECMESDYDNAVNMINKTVSNNEPDTSIEEL